MNKISEHIIKANGINLHLVPNKKHKTISFTVKLKAPLSRETISKRALLPYILQQGTATYPSRQAIQLKLDSLYGAVLSIDGTKKGDHHIISIRIETANQKFIPDDPTIMNETIALLKEIIFQPLCDGDMFPETIINREKSTLLQKINAIMDDKMSYANMRLIDEMCNDEAYSLHLHGYKEDLDAITGESLFKYYKALLKEDQLDFYVSGDFDAEAMQSIITSTFTRSAELNADQTSAGFQREIKTPNVVIEEQHLQQAKLHFGFRTNITYGSDDYFALQVFNGMLGGFPNSKLFINVREKNSLAYYAASRIESHKGLLFVFSGIAPADYEKAREIIEQQVTAMKKGDFTEEEIADTKALIRNQLLETMDHPQGLVELLYQQVVAEAARPPEKLMEGIANVTKEDIISVAEKIQLDTIYLLTSKGVQTNG